MLCGAIVFIFVFNQQKNSRNNNMNLKVSWYSDLKLESHDPANIQFAAPAVLLMNLYSPLLIYNNKSEIDFALAEKFNWISNSELEFKLKSNLLSSKGDPITAEDAYLSFKRLMLKQTNTHGDLQNFLCPGVKLSSIDDECPGLRFKENSLFLKANDPNLAKFLLPLITSCDFLIIPKKAINWQSEDLKIVDYSNTSGPFYAQSTNAKGEHFLKANKNSPLYDVHMPQTVEIKPILDTSSPIKLVNGEIDMITTIDRARPEDLLQLKNDKNFSLHQTSDLEVTILQFTSKGRSILTEQDRLSLGSYIKNRISSSWPKETAYKTADQFFPAFGEASLSESKLNNLKKLYKNDHYLPKQKIKLSVEGYKLEEYKKLFSDAKNIEFIKFTERPNQKKIEEMEDGYILPGDTGFIENISLISYYMSVGSFGYDDKEKANQWIQDYIKINDKTDRLEKLKELHFEALAKGLIVPISITPYYAVAKKDWKLSFHRHFAGTPIWMMRKN